MAPCGICPVMRAAIYDELLADAVVDDAEGTVLPAVPFTAAQADRYADHEPTQAAGVALLRLAWRHRGVLLASDRSLRATLLRSWLVDRA